MSEDAPPYSVDDWIARIGAAAELYPIDWDVISAAYANLSAEAKTPDQKAATTMLRHASNSHGVHLAISAIQRSFLHGKPDVDGWPRKY